MKIVTHPNPILNQPCLPIDLADFDRKKLQKLSKKMLKTMYRHQGIGLAAPQVNLSLRLCVINKQSGNFQADLVLINPLITARSLETTALEEGCLSLPGVKVDVERPVWIKLKATDLKGNKIELEARDLLSRLIQHEVDHLDGVLIIDKLLIN